MGKEEKAMKKFLTGVAAMTLTLLLSAWATGCGGSGGNNGGCKNDKDCPNYPTQFCDLTTNTCKCKPQCTGKCGGPDGCGNTCANTCPAGQTCQAPDYTTCSGTCTPNCTGKCGGPDGCNGNCPNTCPAGQTCQAPDYTTCSGTCTPNCTGKCGGPDGCGNTCANTCPAGQTCQAPDYVTCSGTCTPNCTGKCGGPDGCNGNCPNTCPAGQTCQAPNYTTCSGTTSALCPTGQDCTDVTGSGYLGCTTGGQPPAGAQTNCHTAQYDCTAANSTCFCTQGTPPNACTQSVCIANCGACPTDQLCKDLNGAGDLGCLTLDGQIPTGAPTNCNSTGCQGNASCWCLDANCTQSVCINNCSVDGPCSGNASRCDGTVIYTCTGGQWVKGTDCAASGKVCSNGVCTDTVAAGAFCGGTGQPACPAGQDCVGSPGKQAFCTLQCNCTSGSGCNTTPASDCLFADNPSAPTKCWCGFLCPNNDVTKCPNNGTGWQCKSGSAGGQTIYYCLPQGY